MSLRNLRRVATMATLVLVAATLQITPINAQTPTCEGRVATIVGTPGNDRLVGTSRADVIVGLGGADVIMGLGGPDIICGGFGADSVLGGDGDDLIVGGRGADELTGGDGADTIRGGDGRDVLVGNRGADVLIGGTSADSLSGGRGPDTLAGGLGPDRVVGGDGNDVIAGGGGIDVCAATDSYSTCESPTAATEDRWGSEILVDRVVHVSIDGLRADHVTPDIMPNVAGLAAAGASTMNARTDPDSTRTLPNHTSQFTGRPVLGVFGHGVVVNEDPGGTVHDTAGTEVTSVFDVASSHGVSTAMYSGKEKFEFHGRTWEDSFDVFERNNPAAAVATMLGHVEDGTIAGARSYVMVHIRLPDSAGHATVWGSEEYRESVTESDALVGLIQDTLATTPGWSNTAYIVTTDHGGPIGESLHGAPDLSGNYTIPFVVSAPGVAAGSDLYELNRFGRAEPEDRQLPLTGQQPIRGHEAGNLALDLLGLPPIDGSFFNVGHDLRLN